MLRGGPTPCTIPAARQLKAVHAIDVTDGFYSSISGPESQPPVSSLPHHPADLFAVSLGRSIGGYTDCIDIQAMR